MRTSRTSLITAVLMASCVGSASHAAIVGPGDVTPTVTEGFEDFSYGYHSDPLSVFDGLATITGESGNGVIVARSWHYNGVVTPHAEAKFIGSPGQPVRYRFSMPMNYFGGYFATNSDTADGFIDFFDEEGALIASEALTASRAMDDGTPWDWNGFFLDSPFSEAVVRGNSETGGFVMQDSLEVRVAVPAPASLALAAGAGLLAARRRR